MALNLAALILMPGRCPHCRVQWRLLDIHNSIVTPWREECHSHVVCLVCFCNELRECRYCGEPYIIKVPVPGLRYATEADIVAANQRGIDKPNDNLPGRQL